MDQDKYQNNCPDIAKQETIRKQAYLKTNIMEAGYDVMDFSDYMECEKNEGTNVENWTMEELETAAELFKKTQDMYIQNENQSQVNNGSHSDYKKNSLLESNLKSNTTDTPIKIEDPNSKILGNFISDLVIVLYTSL